MNKNKFIYCYGDIPFFLKYDISKNFWAAIKYDPQSQYQGTLRYASVCRIQNHINMNSGDDSDMVIMTGGVNTATGDPSNACYRINASNAPSLLLKLQDMRYKRYGHCSVDVNGTLYVIGGFCHSEGS